MESGVDSKACSLGSDGALVSAPRAQALLWIITPGSFSGVCAHVRTLFWLRQNEGAEGGGVTDTQKKLLILMSFFHIGLCPYLMISSSQYCPLQSQLNMKDSYNT